MTCLFDNRSKAKIPNSLAVKKYINYKIIKLFARNCDEGYNFK